jgi:1-acyl-sn-glycerol-3-phosphate acyltransferase
MNIFNIPFYVVKAELMQTHIQDYSEKERYALAMKVANMVRRSAGIKTSVYGTQNLPKEGGYVMYANHQGKYDALGIMLGHKEPCSVVMDDKRSHGVVVKQFLDMLGGKRLEKDNLKQSMKIIYEVADEVRNGRKYLIFPAGGYWNPSNRVDPFKPGSFKAAMRVKAPIVPVAIIDSYKAFELNTVGRVKTQVHFLKPLYYEDYKDMKAVEIAAKVEKSIKDCIRKQKADLFI